MLWERAKSSNIDSVGYDPTTKELQVKFHSGAVYRYALVPQDVYDEFKVSGFSGRFLNSTIKGAYDYERID
jgi:hypothetical protein